MGSPFSGDDIRLKRYQRKNFMEKKIKRTTKGAKYVSYSREEKTIIITILVALVIMGALLVKMTVFMPIETEPFSAIYYLDSEKQLTNIPKTVVLGENSTDIKMWVGVENQIKPTMNYSVLVKLDDGTLMNSSLAETIESIEVTVLYGETKEIPVWINIDQLGQNIITFELWFLNGTTPEYTGNWVDLSIEAT